jgi:hypothetical protein
MIKTNMVRQEELVYHATEALKKIEKIKEIK